MTRRKFDKQFKIFAVKLILDEGYSVKEVSTRALGINLRFVNPVPSPV